MDGVKEEDQGGEGWVEILPDDILELIIGSLDFGDLIQFSQVCKQWRTPTCNARKPNGTSYGSPCFVSLADDNRSCTIFDPLRKQEFAIEVPHLPASAKVVAANHGWLLLVGLDFSIFFFHPLSKATINLPKLGFCIPDHFVFSSSPTSADCIVVAYYAYKGYAPICICRRGDNSWKNLEFLENGSFSRSSARPVITKGNMYCLGRDGRVGVFDLTTETWRTFAEPYHLKPNIDAMYIASFGDDELISMFKENTDNENVHLLKMDLKTTENRWVKMENNIGGKCFFAGSVTSTCSAAASPYARDRIYFPIIRDDKEFVCYGFESGELCPMKNLGGAEELDGRHGAWLEPVLVKYPYEELSWNEQEDDFYYSLRDLFQC